MGGTRSFIAEAAAFALFGDLYWQKLVTGVNYPYTIPPAKVADLHTFIPQEEL